MSVKLKKGSENWYKDLYGDSNMCGLKSDAPEGMKGVWFWGKEFFDPSKPDSLENKVKLLNSARHMAKLITKKPITVRYSEEGKDQSFTDGHSITISSIISQNYDSTIGLVCHEASHVELTDFRIIRQLMSKNPDTVTKVLDVKYHKYTKIIKDLHNVVEDRRIDQWVYNSAPGFRIYYKELYKRYYLSPIINEAIKQGFFFDTVNGIQKDLTEETLSNYLFYVINIVNTHIKRDVLKGFPEIVDTFDIHNISRLLNTKDTLDVAVQIFDIILKNLPPEEQEKMDDDHYQPGFGDGDDDSEAEEFDGTLEDLLEAMKNGTMRMGGKGGKKIKLSDELLKQLQDHMKSQKDFLEGSLAKGKMSSGEASQLDTLSKCESSMEHVKDGSNSYKVLTVTKINSQLINSGIYSAMRPYEMYKDVVDSGLALGQMLGKKLKVRTEERELVTTRLKSGKIHRSRLAHAGHNAEDLFYNRIIDKTQNGNVHISLDISGSMDGEKWRKTLKSTVAIAKACSMIQGVRCQISLRYSDSVASENLPIVLNFYDSAFDGPAKIRLMSHITPAGATPEGLCFDALMQKIMAPILNVNTLFINFSDGLPGMYGIGSDAILRITKKSIRGMKECGVKVLSYYIEDGYSYGGGSAESVFKDMYGEKESKFINVNELTALAKTINHALIKLGSK